MAVMGLILSIDEINEHMDQLGLLNPQTKRTLVYGQVMPNAGQLFLFGAYAQLVKGAYFVMSLEENRIILIPLSKISGKIDKKAEPIFIPHEELEGIILKNGMMMHSATFLGKEQELTLKFAKNGIGMKWHKENLNNTMRELEKLQKVVGTGE